MHRRIKHGGWLGANAGRPSDYTTMYQFGYKLLAAMAPLIFVTNLDAAPSLWRPVFALGPKGDAAIEYFLSSFFLCLKEGTDTATFVARWRPMIQSVMGGKDWKGGPWCYQELLERHVLAFANPDALARPSTERPLTESIQDLCKAWAEKRLTGDEDNLAAFCSFLGTKAGAPLRLDGLVWIANALPPDSEGRRWYRDGTSVASVDFLSTVVTERKGGSSNPEARRALIDLTGLAVSRQLSAALAIQDHLKALL